MGASNSVFHLFRPHDEIEIETVDHVLDMMSFTSRWSGLRSTMPVRCGSISRSTLQEGRVVQVQYGKVSNMDATSDRGRKARLCRGDSKIGGMRHLTPRITPLALSLMRWGMGDARCARELGRYAERAATTQSETAFTALDGSTIELSLGCGCITPKEVPVGRSRLSMQGIHLTQTIPDTLLAAMAGRRIDEIVDHPAVRDGGEINLASRTDTGTYIHLAPTMIDVPDAIAAINEQNRMAA